MNDSRLLLLRQALTARPGRRLQREPGCVPAAVALILRPRQDLEMLLIKRAENDDDPWSGHMALPGGRQEADDRTLQDTAFRETLEETSIRLQQNGHLLGSLDQVAPETEVLPPIQITPFVVGVHADTAAKPNPHEVESALWVPLPQLRRPESETMVTVAVGNRQEMVPALQYDGHVIWGLTHRILCQFLRLADSCGV